MAIIILAAASLLEAAAQLRSNGYDVTVEFPRDKSNIIYEYENNNLALAEIDNIFDKINAGTAQLKSITVAGWSSPNGQTEANLMLAEKRRNMLVRYLLRNYDFPESLITLKPGAISWHRLAEKITAGEDFVGKDEALAIVNDYSQENPRLDTRRHRLMGLHAGKTWKYVYEHYFNYMQCATATIVLTENNEEETVEVEVVEEKIEEKEIPEISATQDTISQLQPTEDLYAKLLTDSLAREDFDDEDVIIVDNTRRRCLLAITSNLLYDAAAIPNIGFELMMGKHFSLKADWKYAWWSKDSEHFYWRDYGGDVSLRYYFNDAKYLAGHHLGVYGQMTTYDFELGGRGYQAPRWQYGGGLEYGYAISLSQHFNLDFSLSIGYLTGKLSEYTTSEGHYYENERKTMHFVGPTAAKISLVYLLFKNKKGGAR